MALVVKETFLRSLGLTRFLTGTNASPQSWMKIWRRFLLSVFIFSSFYPKQCNWSLLIDRAPMLVALLHEGFLIPNVFSKETPWFLISFAAVQWFEVDKRHAPWFLWCAFFKPFSNYLKLPKFRSNHGLCHCGSFAMVLESWTTQIICQIHTIQSTSNWWLRSRKVSRRVMPIRHSGMVLWSPKWTISAAQAISSR